MLITVSEANFEGNGNADVAEYSIADVKEMLQNQPSIVNLEQVNIIKKGDSEEVSALIGVDVEGKQFRTPTSQMALPCPHYCSGGHNFVPLEEVLSLLPKR